MSGGRFVKVDFDQPLPSQPAAARPPVPDYSPHSAPAQAGPYNIYQGRGLAFRN